ncbi:thiamine pyrophosphate-binding protein [Halobacteriaceae archaeon GCM10025711]
MPVTDDIVSVLESAGVEHAFGFPCEQMEPYYASLHDADVRHVLARSEASAAMMADGYARTSGSLGVCDGVGGPGAAYLGAGLVEADGASSAVLAFTGDNDRSYRGDEAIQDADNRAILGPHVSASYDPESPARAVDAVRNAVREAVTGVPSPVHVNLTEDVMEGDADGGPPDAPPATVPAVRPEPDEASVERIADLLEAADAPVILSGEGALRSRAWDAVGELARRTRTSVVTSMNGKGIVAETEPYAAGVAGRWGYSQPANDAVEAADLVVALGARFGELTTVGWSLVPDDAAIVHVDLDPHWLGRNYDVDVPVLADVRATVERVLAAVDESAFADRDGRIETLAAAYDEWRASHADSLESEAEPVSPARVVAEVQRATPPEALVVSATSFPGFFSGAFYQVRDPGIGYIQARGSDGINVALPQALGAQMASPDRPVVVLTGDGGVGYHIADLETAVREELPVTVVVFNNGSLGSSKMSMIANWNVDVSTDFAPETDYAAVARGFGCEGQVVEDPAALPDALDAAVASDEPTLLDVRVDPYAAPPVIV